MGFTSCSFLETGLIEGKVCLVTGANSGIGKATAAQLAQMGGKVILACRNSDRAETARQDIIQKTGNSNVEVGLVDLSSQKSIHSFVDSFKRERSRLHVLVNNAGIYSSRRVVTEDGLELVFATNHLGHFLLTNLLLDILKASAPSRIVNVTSEAQRTGMIDFDDLQGERRFSGTRAYPQSKLANVLFTYELARRLDGTEVTATCVHPGAVRTNFGRGSRGLMAFAVRIFAPFMLSPEEGARTVIHLASSPDLEGVSGKYFAKLKEIRSSKDSYDQQIARRLWMVSAELTGLKE